MSSAAYTIERKRQPNRLAYYARVIRVNAGIEFKMKYHESALGYAWSLAKPLAYFGVLWIVFQRVFAVRTPVDSFALYLIVGLVLYLFFIDGVGMALTSVVARGSLLRRLAFSPLVLPLSATATAAMTFAVNTLAVAVFLVAARQTPSLEWLLVFPLLVELFLFIVGVGLIAATMFVRFRDVAQIWELVAQLLIFMTPVMYPLSLLPGWAEKALFFNPLVQVMQDTRAVLLGSEGIDTANDVLGTAGHAVPIAMVVLTFALGMLLFMREAPRFAERV